MKRIKKFIVCAFAVVVLCGCSDVITVEEENKDHETPKPMFVQSVK